MAANSHGEYRCKRCGETAFTKKRVKPRPSGRGWIAWRSQSALC